MSNNLPNLKNCNVISSSTPNREPNSKFRTPVNRSSAFEWSPNVQFGTPNINSPSLELPRTPAMLASLGIKPESNADISWQSCMATPSSVTEAIGTTVYHTPTETSDDKSKLQSRVLFQNSAGITNISEKVCNLDSRVPSIVEGDQLNSFNSPHRNSQENNHKPLLSLFTKKPAVKFVYPKPVFIQMKHGSVSSYASAANQVDTAQEALPETENDFAPSPVISQRQRRKKKARKNLQFSETSSSGSSLPSQESCNSIDGARPSSALLCEPMDDLLPKHSPEPKQSTLVGFTKFPDVEEENFNTRGRQIPLSECALSRSKALFWDAENESTGSNQGNLRESSEAATCTATSNSNSTMKARVQSGKFSGIHDKSREKNHEVGLNSKLTPCASGLVGGFRTDVSHGRLDDGCDQVAANEAPHVIPSRTIPLPTSSAIGFSTASGKNVAISTKALDRARKIFDDCDKYEEAPTCQSVQTNLNSSVAAKTVTKTVGFSTASGIGVAISAGSLARAKQIFEDCQSESGPNEKHVNSLPTKASSVETTGVGFSTASGKGVAISAKSLTRAKKIFEECQSESEPNKVHSNVAPAKTSSSVGCAGFGPAMNANEQRVPSAESIKRTKKIFEGYQSEFHQDELPSVRSSFSIPTSTRDNGAAGFSTASGKGVAISAKSMARAKQIFEDCQTENFQEENDTPKLPPATSIVRSSGPAGFSTASGKGVSVSAESLARARQIYENCQKESVQEIDHKSQAAATAVRTEGFAGFSTASGKNVAISSQALARAKKFVDESIDQTKERTQVSSSSFKQIPTFVKVEEDVGHRKRKKDEESDSDRSPSPVLGKKKRNDSPLTANSHESGLTQTQLFMLQEDPTDVAQEILTIRRRARQIQLSLIEAKRNRRVQVVANPGPLYRMKNDPSVKRKSLSQFASTLLGKASLSPALFPDQLISKGLLVSVCAVDSANAASFKFYGWEYFSLESCKNNGQGLQFGEFNLILSDHNSIGCDEISASFLASSYVDPSLISEGWIRNHYRWIIWKLACMEIRFPDELNGQCLNPANVLEQLKYRYDREIDNSQRSALRRIIEQDDTPAKTMILCISAIDSNPSVTGLELTDGWYCIKAQIDPFLKNLADTGKIYVGLKLIISGAELVSPGPTTPLEMGPDTYLKINANSVRRARWSSRLGFYVNPQPFPISLRSIVPEGGLVSLVRVVVARIYPVVFMEKNAEGKTLFRSERYYRKTVENVASDYERMMEKIMEDVERETDEEDRKRRRINGNRLDFNLTDEEKSLKIQVEARKRMEQVLSTRKQNEGVAVLRMRLVDWQSNDSTSAVLSVWRPSADLHTMIKENHAYRLYHVTTSGLRFREIQLNSVKQTRWDEIKDSNHIRNRSQVTSVPPFHRTVTSFQAASQRGFKPSFNELDLVGLVVHVVKPPNKNSFQTAVLYDGMAYFGVKCWSGFDDYALDDVIVTGAFLSFSNLQWRANSSSGRMPSAFISEATVVSSRPAAKHLDQSLKHLKQLLSDPAACVTEAESHLTQLLVNNGTPSTSTPNQSMTDGTKGFITPTFSTDGRKETPSSSSVSNQPVGRSRLLEKYGPPPSLLPLNITPSNTVRQRFKPPAKKSSAA